MDVTRRSDIYYQLFFNPFEWISGIFFSKMSFHPLYDDQRYKLIGATEI